jgi:hypothetical protein
MEGARKLVEELGSKAKELEEENFLLFFFWVKWKLALQKIKHYKV